LQRETESTLNEFAWLRGGNTRDLTLNAPIELFPRQIVAGGSPLIGVQTFGLSNLLTWSACARAGAGFLTGLSRSSTLWSIGELPTPQWLPEIDMIAPSEPVFARHNVSPEPISGMLVVSRQLLVQQTGPELDRILIGDLSRQLASYLDQSALYGGGPRQVSRPAQSTFPVSRKVLRLILRICAAHSARLKPRSKPPTSRWIVSLVTA
jgi:hypothetical protein